MNRSRARSARKSSRIASLGGLAAALYLLGCFWSVPSAFSLNRPGAGAADDAASHAGPSSVNPERKAMDYSIAVCYRDHALDVLATGDGEAYVRILEAGMDWAATLSDIPALLALHYNDTGRSVAEVLSLVDRAFATNLFLKTDPEALGELRANLLLELGRREQALAQLAALEATESRELVRLRALVSGPDNGGLFGAFETALERWPLSAPLALMALDYASLFPVDARVRSLVDRVLSRREYWERVDSGFLWRAALFTRDFAERRRLSSRAIVAGNRESGAILGALDTGAIDAPLAMDYFFGREGEPLVWNDLERLWTLLRTDGDRSLFRSRMEHLSGVVAVPAANTLLPPLELVYEEGLPVFISIDRDGDRLDEWLVSCRDGRPFSARWQSASDREALELVWDTYPALLRVSRGELVFHFANSSVSWALFKYTEQGWTSERWRYPLFDDRIGDPSDQFFVSHAMSLERPGSSIHGSREYLTLSGGLVQSAYEEKDGHVVARKVYARGLLVREDLDMDLDGRMETRRRYRADLADSSILDPLFGPQPRLSTVELDIAGTGVWTVMESY